jgi:hypothetical protein
MAFGVLFDFNLNSNASIITPAGVMVKEKWFIDAVNYPEPIDMFIVVGHNPVGRRSSIGTFPIINKAIRKFRPDVPVMFFGGHSHVRDAAIYDDKSVALASGRFCETIGWLAVDGLQLPHYKASAPYPKYPLPTKPAVVWTYPAPVADNTSSLRYDRRYLDWNRVTMQYHTRKQPDQFDIQTGKAISAQITGLRQQLSLNSVIACAPQTWCMSCRPFGDPGNIYSELLPKALSHSVINDSRTHIPRMIFINTGCVRFDLLRGPFTFDDSLIVAPFSRSTFKYLPNVPYSAASNVLANLNALPYLKAKRGLKPQVIADMLEVEADIEVCEDPVLPRMSAMGKRDVLNLLPKMKRDTAISPGHTTNDDFGADGDDTVHTPIAHYPQPNAIEAKASFPTDGILPKTVDLILVNYTGLITGVLAALRKTGHVAEESDIQDYLLPQFNLATSLSIYAKDKWSINGNNCLFE